MTTSELRFENDAAFVTFQRELQSSYPDQCRDSLGNVCTFVTSQALEITERVDRGEINQRDAQELAQAGAVEMAKNCRQGLSETRKCGFGVLCAMGIAE